MSPELRIYRLLPRTQAEGPGWRACLWVQGCSLACPGCFNTHLWSANGGRRVPAERILSEILAVDGIEGVTFLGGEPFEQAEALAWLAERLRREGLSVMTFTGYWLGDLPSRGPAAASLLAESDLLVDGPYDLKRPDHVRPWVGSTNQRFHFLSSRYAHLADRLETLPDRLEVRIEPGGNVFLNGMADKHALTAIRRAVRGQPEGLN